MLISMNLKPIKEFQILRRNWLDKIFILRGDKLQVTTWILFNFYHVALMCRPFSSVIFLHQIFISTALG
jgi:hypothetical protein